MEANVLKGNADLSGQARSTTSWQLVPIPLLTPRTARRLAINLLYLDLPFDLLGLHARRRAAIDRCKPCVNAHDSSDMPKYLQLGLTQHVLNFAPKKIPSVPRHSYRRGGSSVNISSGEHHRPPVAGGVVAVLNKTGCKRLSEPSWEREMNLQHSRTQMLGI